MIIDNSGQLLNSIAEKSGDTICTSPFVLGNSGANQAGPGVSPGVGVKPHSRFQCGSRRHFNSSSLSRLRLGAQELWVEQPPGRPVLGLERLSHPIAPSESPARRPSIIARPVGPIKDTVRTILLPRVRILFSRADPGRETLHVFQTRSLISRAETQGRWVQRQPRTPFFSASRRLCASQFGCGRRVCPERSRTGRAIGSSSPLRAKKGRFSLDAQTRRVYDDYRTKRLKSQ